MISDNFRRFNILIRHLFRNKANFNEEKRILGRMNFFSLIERKKIRVKKKRKKVERFYSFCEKLKQSAVKREWFTTLERTIRRPDLHVPISNLKTSLFKFFDELNFHRCLECVVCSVHFIRFYSCFTKKYRWNFFVELVIKKRHFSSLSFNEYRKMICFMFNNDRDLQSVKF